MTVGSPATDVLAETRPSACRSGCRSASMSATRPAPPSTTRCCTSRPTGRCPAATASSCPPAANGSSGDGRRIDAQGHRHRLRAARRAHLLGELHAARPHRPVRPGLDVYLAPTWDNSDVWVPTLRHIAKEGRTYVIGVTSCIRAADLPADLPGARDALDGGGDRDDWLSRGNSAIIGPGGEVLAGPLAARKASSTPRSTRGTRGRPASSSTRSATTAAATCSGRLSSPPRAWLSRSAAATRSPDRRLRPREVDRRPRRTANEEQSEDQRAGGDHDDNRTGKERTRP